MIKKLVLVMILICVLISGCGKPEAVGYTYEMDEESNLVRLLDIYTFDYNMNGEAVEGVMTIDDTETTFSAIKVDVQKDYDMFHGTLKYGDIEYLFDISFFQAGSVTGLFYDEQKVFVNGFVIE